MNKKQPFVSKQQKMHTAQRNRRTAAKSVNALQLSTALTLQEPLSIQQTYAVLSNSNLPTVQRRDFANNIGKFQGNRYLCQLLKDGEPVQNIETMQKTENERVTGQPISQSLTAITDAVNGATGEPSLHAHFAGSPARQDAPNGLASLAAHSSSSSAAALGGLTLTSNAAAFTPPAFVTRNVPARNGHQVAHYAEVQPTAAGDVVHDSFYLGPGRHLRPAFTQTINGRTVRHYVQVTPALSALIRRGEQEHLDDARRAYELTYGLIAAQINALVGQRFGPANTPADAEQLAATTLTRRLPQQLGINPATWVRLLDLLLRATGLRDKNGWHALDYGPPQERGNRIIYTLAVTSTTAIGQVPSTDVVNYPS